MITQWENGCISLPILPVAPGSIPSQGGIFQGIFRWLITLCQPVLNQRGRKCLNGTTRPVDMEEEGRSPTTDRRWLKKTFNQKVCSVPTVYLLLPCIQESYLENPLSSLV